MKKKLLLISSLLLANSLILTHGGGGGGHGGGGGGGHSGGGGHAGYHGGGHGGYGHGGYGHGGYGYGHGGYRYGHGGYGYGWGGVGLGVGLGLMATTPFLFYGDRGYPYSTDQGLYENPNYNPNASQDLEHEQDRQTKLDEQAASQDSNHVTTKEQKIKMLEAELHKLESTDTSSDDASDAV